MPILSFPGVQLLGKTVDELVHDGHLQAHCMKEMADRYDMGVAVSLMDLFVESWSHCLCFKLYKKNKSKRTIFSFMKDGPL